MASVELHVETPECPEDAEVLFSARASPTGQACPGVVQARTRATAPKTARFPPQRVRIAKLPIFARKPDQFAPALVTAQLKTKPDVEGQ